MFFPIAGRCSHQFGAAAAAAAAAKAKQMASKAWKATTKVFRSF